MALLKTIIMVVFLSTVVIVGSVGTYIYILTIPKSDHGLERQFIDHADDFVKLKDILVEDSKKYNIWSFDSAYFNSNNSQLRNMPDEERVRIKDLLAKTGVHRVNLAFIPYVRFEVWSCGGFPITTWQKSKSIVFNNSADTDTEYGGNSAVIEIGDGTDRGAISSSNWPDLMREFTDTSSGDPHPYFGGNEPDQNDYSSKKDLTKDWYIEYKSENVQHAMGF